MWSAEVHAATPLLLALGVHRLLRQRGHVREILVVFCLAGAAIAVFLPYEDGLVGRSPVNWLTILALPPLRRAVSRSPP